MFAKVISELAGIFSPSSRNNDISDDAQRIIFIGNPGVGKRCVKNIIKKKNYGFIKLINESNI